MLLSFTPRHGIYSVQLIAILVLTVITQQNASVSEAHDAAFLSSPHMSSPFSSSEQISRHSAESPKFQTAPNKRKMQLEAEVQRFDGWYNNLAHPSWGSLGKCEHIVNIFFLHFLSKLHNLDTCSHFQKTLILLDK